MRLKRHVALLESSLKHTHARPLLPSQLHHRRFASSSAPYPEQIAILGGGISGLSSAYFISKEFPKSRITIFESGKEAGGWIKSRRVDVKGGNVLFEYGPRTLRPGAGALPTAQLIQDLGLTEDVLYTSKDSVAASHRYIYYPDRLNQLPGSPSGFTLSNIVQLWRSGLLRGVWGVLTEPWKPRRPHSQTDESIGDFVSRRLDKQIADNLVSAVGHGIYAGDIYQLSAKTLFGLAWQLESRYGSTVWGLSTAQGEESRKEFVTLWHPYDWEEYKAIRQETKLEDEFMRKLAPKKTSTFTFKEGLQSFVKRLEGRLRQNEQVEISTESPIKSFGKAKDGSEQVEVVAGNDAAPAPRNFDFVVSTLPHTELTPTVTVMVVNLYYTNPALVPVRGFGYLIPRSVPFEQNPERALGVIFDHDAVTGQDTTPTPGTKLTVMLGGHWWNDWTDYPDSTEGAEMAKCVLRRHLGINVEPDACHVTLNKNCIPQYTVGYEARLKDLAVELQNTYRGRLRVVGSQYNGVGVNDCVRGAWSLARGMRGNGWRGRSAGLDRVLDERAWIREPFGKVGG